MGRGSITLLMVLAGFALVPRGARADRVVLLEPGGEAPQQRLVDVDQALADAVRAVGDEPLTERMASQTGNEPPPQTANEMRAIAELQGAQWTLVPEVREEPGGAGYWLTLHAGYVPGMRVETVTSEVRDSREAPRLVEILTALLRPKGLGDDADRVSGEDAVARRAEAGSPDAGTGQPPAGPEGPTESETARAEREAQARSAFEAREKAQQQGTAQTHVEQAQDRWSHREQYGQTAPWLLQIGLGARPIVAHPFGGAGGTLGAVELRAGRSFERAPGLEARAGLDLMFGASTAFTLYGGAAYLASFVQDVPVFLGVSLELGLFQPLTGGRHTSFMLRAAPTVAWRFAKNWFLEGALPEVMWLSAGGGAVTLGLSARLGIRF